MLAIGTEPPDSSALKRISIIVGKYREPQELLLALQNADVTFSDRTQACILSCVPLAEKRSITTVAFVTPYILGLEGLQPLHAIVQAAAERNLKPCAPEVGPMLRLDYLAVQGESVSKRPEVERKQPLGEWAVVVCHQLYDEHGAANFVLGNVRGQRYLNAEPGDAAISFKSDTLFVFAERNVRPMDRSKPDWR